jgi:hypothetical protein
MARKQKHVNVAEAKAYFSSLVRRAAGGEDIVIARDGKIVSADPSFGKYGVKRIW